MGLHVDLVEAVWVLVNGSTFILSLLALHSAQQDRDAVRALNGQAYELAANGAVRREAIRVIIQTLFLLIVLPGLFIDRDTPLNFFVLVFMAIPILLLYNSALDARDRRTISSIVLTRIQTQEDDDHKPTV